MGLFSPDTAFNAICIRKIKKTAPIPYKIDILNLTAHYLHDTMQTSMQLTFYLHTCPTGGLYEKDN